MEKENLGEDIKETSVISFEEKKKSLEMKREKNNNMGRKMNCKVKVRLYSEKYHEFEYVKEEGYDEEIKVYYGTSEDDIYKKLQKYGMPALYEGSRESIDNYSYRDKCLFDSKLNHAGKSKIIPLCKPMDIEDDDIHYLIYDSKEGTVCVKYVHFRQYSEREDFYYPKETCFEVLGYEEMLKELKDMGLEFDISRLDATKFVKECDYQGIKGCINKLSNFITYTKNTMRKEIERIKENRER